MRTKLISVALGRVFVNLCVGVQLQCPHNCSARCPLLIHWGLLGKRCGNRISMTIEQLKTLQRLAPLHRTQALPARYLASMFQCSPRHLRRLRQQSMASPLPRLPWNRLSEDVQRAVIDLKREQPTLNCQWISELVSDRFERLVSRSSVWRILARTGLLQTRPAEPTIRKRFEAQASGDLVQLDTTWGYWLGLKRLCLILLLDDYSRYILAAEFFWEDSAYNNMLMIRDVVQDYGVFRLLYTDNASFFKVIRHNQSRFQEHRQAEYESEITRACRQIGITHFTHRPYQPQGKGKIERLFRFLQERLMGQLRAGMDLEQANLKLWEWVDWYNLKHVNRTMGTTPKKRFDPAGFTPLSGKTHLDDVFCFQDTRKVDKCNQFSYQGMTYMIPPEHCLVACRITLHVHPFRYLRVWHNGTFIGELPYQHSPR